MQYDFCLRYRLILAVHDRATAELQTWRSGASHAARETLNFYAVASFQIRCGTRCPCISTDHACHEQSQATSIHVNRV